MVRHFGRLSKRYVQEVEQIPEDLDEYDEQLLRQIFTYDLHTIIYWLFKQ